jgi:hypothetical protein
MLSPWCFIGRWLTALIARTHFVISPPLLAKDKVEIRSTKASYPPAAAGVNSGEAVNADGSPVAAQKERIWHNELRETRGAKDFVARSAWGRT